MSWPMLDGPDGAKIGAPVSGFAPGRAPTPGVAAVGAVSAKPVNVAPDALPLGANTAPPVSGAAPNPGPVVAAATLAGENTGAPVSGLIPSGRSAPTDAGAAAPAADAP